MRYRARGGPHRVLPPWVLPPRTTAGADQWPAHDSDRDLLLAWQRNSGGRGNSGRPALNRAAQTGLAPPYSYPTPPTARPAQRSAARPSGTTQRRPDARAHASAALFWLWRTFSAFPLPYPRARHPPPDDARASRDVPGRDTRPTELPDAGLWAPRRCATLRCVRSRVNSTASDGKHQVERSLPRGWPQRWSCAGGRQPRLSVHGPAMISMQRSLSSPVCIHSSPRRSTRRRARTGATLGTHR